VTDTKEADSTERPTARRRPAVQQADTDGRGQLAVLTPGGFARLEKAYPTLLAAVREHIMDHLADLGLASFTQSCRPESHMI
jgi:hypothetical protein